VLFRSVRAEGDLALTDGNTTTFNVSGAGSVEVDAAKGSTGAVAIVANNAENVSISAGDDLNITGSRFDKAHYVTLNQRAGELSGDVDLSSVNHLTVSGAGNDSSVTLRTLGSATQAYALTVDASGLHDGLTFAEIAVGVTGGIGQDVTLNLTDVEGEVIGSTIGATGNVRDVTVNAATIGTTALDDITARGTVNINALGIIGGGTTTGADDALNIGNIVGGDTAVVNVKFDGSSDVGFGTIAGKTVNFDASGYLGEIVTTSVATSAEAVVGAITGVTATVKGSALSANTFSGANLITADTLDYTGGIGVDTVSVTDKAVGSTTLTATFDTGLGDDVVTLTGIAGTTSIIAKGNLGDGEDSVAVVATAPTAKTIIDLSGLNGYEVGTISERTTGMLFDGTVTNTLIGGVGKDTFAVSKFAAGSASDSTGDSATTIIKNFDVANDMISLGTAANETSAKIVTGATTGLTSLAAVLGDAATKLAVAATLYYVGGYGTTTYVIQADAAADTGVKHTAIVELQGVSFTDIDYANIVA
jgi:hypothetical protein